MSERDLTDAERHPTLSAHGQRMLDHLHQHPHAPLFRNRAGSRLTAADLAQVRAIEAEAAATPASGPPGMKPPWLAAWATRCYGDVPYFRARGTVPALFEAIPPTTRAELADHIESFVPDSLALDRLINFRSSGTTGHPLLIPSHPVVAASYLAFHRRALRRHGIELRAARGEVCVALLGYQQRCFTYASVAPTLDEAGYVKLNLYPADWRDPGDRAHYLDALRPELYSGDPISFAALLALPVRWKPRALVSTAMTLAPPLRAALAARFECPVIDVYSLSEAGPVAVADARAGGHALLQHRLYVEILDGEGAVCAAGTRGEITLSGGFNHCLPLLRYRTGDYATLDCAGPEPLLRGLSGRAPVLFRAADGGWINNIEFTHALRPLALRQFRVHQHADGRLRFDYDAEQERDAEVRGVLHGVLGGAARIAIRRARLEDLGAGQYTSELAEGGMLKPV